MSSLQSLIQDCQKRCTDTANGELLAPVIGKALEALACTTDSACYDHDRVVQSLHSMDVAIEATRRQEADHAPVRGLVWDLLKVTHLALGEVADRRKRDEKAHKRAASVPDFCDDAMEKDEEEGGEKGQSAKAAAPKRAPRGYAYISESEEGDDEEKTKEKVVTHSARGRPKRRSSAPINYAKLNRGMEDDDDDDEEEDEVEKDTISSQSSSRSARVDYARLVGVGRRTRPTRSVSTRSAAATRDSRKRARDTSSLSSDRVAPSKRRDSGGKIGVKKEGGEGENKTPSSSSRKKPRSARRAPRGYAYLSEPSEDEDEKEKEEIKKNPTAAFMKCVRCEDFITNSVYRYTYHLQESHQTTAEKEGIYFKCECGHLGRSTNHSGWNQCGGTYTTIVYLEEEDEEEEEEGEQKEENEVKGKEVKKNGNDEGEDGEKEKEKNGKEGEEGKKDKKKVVLKKEVMEEEDESEEEEEEEEKEKKKKKKIKKEVMEEEWESEEEEEEEEKEKEGEEEEEGSDDDGMSTAKEEEEEAQSSRDNPACFLCRARLSTCAAFVGHLHDKHATTVLQHGYTVKCACSYLINSRAQAATHLKVVKCKGTAFSLIKVPKSSVKEEETETESESESEEEE